jgi:hypothetical protein
MRVEVFRSVDPGWPDEWRVEAFDVIGDGDAHLATFSGPDAEDRAWV